LLVDRDQPQEPRNHPILAVATDGHGLGQGSVGLPHQRPAHPAQLLVTGNRRLATSADTAGELFEGERQQR
jgi:hypothetical protein